MLSSLNMAATGLYNATLRLDASAKRTVEANTVVDERAIEPVEQISAKQEFAANTATVRTADQMMGTLLDIKA